MHVRDEKGFECPYDKSPIYIHSCETDEKVLFEGNTREFEEGVLRLYFPDDNDEDEKPDPNIYISDEVRKFVLKYKDEGY